TTHGGDGLTSPAATAEIIHDDQPPSVVFSAPPAGIHVRGAVNVATVARDDGSGVASVTLRAAGQSLAPALAPVPPAATVSASADLTFSWRLGGAAWSAFAPVTSATLTDLAEGQHVFEVKARDRAGNEDLTPARRAFRIVSGPVITAIVPSSGVAGTFVTLSGHGFSAGPVAVAFNGVPALVRTAA